MSNPINQHYVPRCYLKNFCDTNNGVQRLSLEFLDIKHVSPKAICFQPNFYNIDDSLKAKFKEVSGHDEFKAESDILARSESKYPAWFTKVTVDRILSNQECRNISEFIITLKTRTKAWRDKVIRNNIKNNLDGLAEKISNGPQYKDLLKNFPKELVEKAMRNATDVFKNDPDGGKYLQLYRILKTDNQSEFLDLIEGLMNSKWTILINNTATPFITTDNPGVSLNTETRQLHSVGFNKSFVFMLPLSPIYLLRLDCTKSDNCSSEKLISSTRIQEEEAHRINLWLIGQADEFVVSSDRSTLKNYKDIIAKHRLLKRNP